MGKRFVVDHIVMSLKVRLLQMETFTSLQGGDNYGDQGVFTRTSKPNSKAHTKKGHHKKRL